MLAEEYEQKEQEGGSQHGNGSNKIIYDCMDMSPYYEKGSSGTSGLAEGPYVDDQDCVDLGPDESDAAYGRDFPRK